MIPPSKYGTSEKRKQVGGGGGGWGLKYKKCVGKKMKIAMAFQKKLLILTCVVLSFMNYYSSVY